MQRKSWWQSLRHLLFSEGFIEKESSQTFATGQSLRSPGSTVMRLSVRVHTGFGQGLNKPLCNVYSSSPLYSSARIFPIFFSFDLMEIVQCSHPGLLSFSSYFIVIPLLLFFTRIFFFQFPSCQFSLSLLREDGRACAELNQRALCLVRMP